MRREITQVVMVPWLAFGHLNAFLQLAIALAKQGVEVSFLSTSHHINRLVTHPNKLPSLVNLVGFPILEDVVETATNINIPLEKMIYLSQVFSLIQEPIKHFISQQKPNWIIAEQFPNWLVDFNIPIVLFSHFAAAYRVFFGPQKTRGSSSSDVGTGDLPLHQILTTPPPWVDFPSTAAFRKYEAIELIAFRQGENASRETLLQPVVIEDACRAVAIRSCPEFEADYFETHRKIFGSNKVTIPIGMLPSLELDERILQNQPELQRMSKWLDQQKAKSVVFVGFGTECKLSKNQLGEIANGLQLSGLPFLFLLQKHNDLEDLGKQEKTEGLVHIGWAPQKEILAHPSIGGCLIHAGWNSSIECLQHGHVLVVLPFQYDQGLNARLLVDKGVAVEVERNDEDGSFNANDIAASLTKAMVSEEGKVLRVGARNAARVFGNRELNDSYIRDFVKYLKSNKNRNDHEMR